MSQICCEYADQLGSCSRSAYIQQALVQLTILSLSRVPGEAMVWAPRRSNSAEAQSTSAVLQPGLQGGPKPHKVIFSWRL